MSILPMYKKCKICHNEYSWNPDVGHIVCPYCTGKEKPSKSLLSKLMGKNSDAMSIDIDTDIIKKR